MNCSLQCIVKLKSLALKCNGLTNAIQCFTVERESERLKYNGRARRVVTMVHAHKYKTEWSNIYIAVQLSFCEAFCLHNYAKQRGSYSFLVVQGMDNPLYLPLEMCVRCFFFNAPSKHCTHYMCRCRMFLLSVWNIPPTCWINKVHYERSSMVIDANFCCRYRKHLRYALNVLLQYMGYLR